MDGFKMRVSLPCSMLRCFVVCLIVGHPFAASAQDKPTLRTDVPPALAERLFKEGEAREACKKSICDAARSKKAEGDPLSCKVVKTWPAQDLKDKILKGKMDWKWGHAQCEAEVKLDRSLVAKVMSEAKLEIKVGKHKVACNLEQEDGKESHKINFTIDPVVTFENGKAVKAVLGWTDVDGTTLAKSALWSATAVDNTFNVLQGVVLEQINEFFGPKCDVVLK
jgi:hypothetical protein